VGRLVVRAYRSLGAPIHDDYLAALADAAGRARDALVLVAVDGEGRLLGSVTYVGDAASPHAEIARDGEAAFRMLGVDPEAHGRGAGEALVRACIDRAVAHGRRGIAISTAPVMTAAQRLYERLGFERRPDRDWRPLPDVELWAYVLDLERRDRPYA
jgi:ribosomal protein S18 acetylase RimI-like enzyme